MNIPLQNCPFCVPNTTTLSNTIAVKGSGIEFTEKPIKVVGTLVFDKFSDDYGYEYEFRIQDAEVVELDEKEVSDKMKVYYTLIENDCIAILYTMCMYIDQAAYYEEYELTPDDIIADGILNFDEYETVHNTLTSLNTNGEYDKFISAFETANKYRLEVNEAINTGNVEKLPEFKDAADMCVDNFFKFISEYEF